MRGKNMASAECESVKVLAFDVFGTVVDWHGGIGGEVAAQSLTQDVTDSIGSTLMQRMVRVIRTSCTAPTGADSGRARIHFNPQIGATT